MRRICAVDTIRAAEAGAGVPEPVLMQRASTALAGRCLDLLRLRPVSVRGARIVALVGSGNNGGDTLWALSLLARRGIRCTALGDPGRMHDDGSAAALAAGVCVVDLSDPGARALLAEADLALDGIVGIGGTGGLREPWARAVGDLAEAGVPIVAVDVPSGVDPDSGEVSGQAVGAAATVCFGVLKPGLLLAPGRDKAGAVAVVDIGLRDADLVPAAWALELADLAISAPAPDAHKYRRGVVGVTAGSAAYPGAALLAVGAARRAGAGMVVFGSGSGSGHLGVADPVAAMVVAAYPDVVLSRDRSVDARCIGPGLGPGAAAADMVLAALDAPAPVVVDASGLDVLATADGQAALESRAGAGLVTVITPHAGEFARLGFDTTGGPLRAAREAAARTGAVVVLKGPGTVVAAPSGVVFVDLFGTAALATAGSGDVLAGLLAGMLAAAAAAAARTRDAVAATTATRATPAAPTLDDVARIAARAVGLHGLAGRLAGAAQAPVTATDVLARLPEAQAAAATASA